MISIKTKQKEKLKTIEIILFAKCTQETLEKLKSTTTDDNWNVVLSDDVLQELTDQRARVFERSEEDYAFVNTREEECKKQIRELKQELERLKR